MAAASALRSSTRPGPAIVRGDTPSAFANAFGSVVCGRDSAASRPVPSRARGSRSDPCTMADGLPPTLQSLIHNIASGETNIPSGPGPSRCKSMTKASRRAPCSRSAAWVIQSAGAREMISPLIRISKQNVRQELRKCLRFRRVSIPSVDVSMQQSLILTRHRSWMYKQPSLSPVDGSNVYRSTDRLPIFHSCPRFFLRRHSKLQPQLFRLRPC